MFCPASNCALARLTRRCRRWRPGSSGRYCAATAGRWRRHRSGKPPVSVRRSIGRAQLSRPTPGRWPRARYRARRGSHPHRRRPSCRRAWLRRAAPAPRRRRPVPAPAQTAIASISAGSTAAARPCWIAATMSSSTMEAKLLARLPAHERVGIMRRKKPQPIGDRPDSFTGAEKSRSSEGSAGWRHRRTRSGSSPRSPAARACRLSPRPRRRAGSRVPGRCRPAVPSPPGSPAAACPAARASGSSAG